MGKHKNSAQDAILLKFMEGHQDIAKGFIKGDKLKVEALWKGLTVDLNSNGPPQKDTSGWKKVWMDWKAAIRKKLAHNSSEARTTGGGPFNKHVLTSTENSIAQISGIYTVIGDIAGTLEFGTIYTINICEDSTENQPSTSRAAVIASSDDCDSHDYVTLNACASAAADVSSATGNACAAGIGCPRKRRHEPTPDDSITKYIKEQTSSMANIAQQMMETRQEGKENVQYIKDIRYQFKEVNNSIKQLATALIESNEENKRHHIQMEKLRYDETILKKRSKKKKK